MNEKQMLSIELQEKLQDLRRIIRDLGSLAVGFSGGVDSSLLLAVAHEQLGDRALAVTGVDASVPQREVEEAKRFCRDREIRHILCRVDPLKEEGYRHNTAHRCYFCKHGIFTEVEKIAREEGIEYMAEGSNVDDLGDYRPGLKAASELGVKSPLRDAGLHKEEIRLIARALDLPTWSKPAYACLASRFVYGEEITEEKLRMVDSAEQYLIEHGFLEERVRMHGDIARIEVPPRDIPKLAEEGVRIPLWERFREIGFSFVTLDLKGYRQGSMNETMNREKKS